jgi:signal peptidase I
MAELAIWLTLLVLLLAASILALRYLAPIFGLASVPLGRATAAVLLGAGLWASLIAVAWRLAPRLPLPWYVPAIVVVAFAILLSLAMARFVLRLNLASAARAGLLLVAAWSGVLAVAAIPLKLCYPAYVIPTNAMSPTLKGRHLAGECPLCGGETVVSFVEDQSPLRPTERLPGELGICGLCLQVAPTTAVRETVRTGDRILVRSLARPRRWDLVVFIYPGGRPQIYVSRLVALPGEQVEVKEGGLWIDGVRQQPPAEIANLKWFVEGTNLLLMHYGNPGFPTRLAADEYFVLGDFSPNSSDSRFWGPVPEKNLRGVVGAVYFPPRSARFLPQH